MIFSEVNTAWNSLNFIVVVSENLFLDTWRQRDRNLDLAIVLPDCTLFALGNCRSRRLHLTIVLSPRTLLTLRNHLTRRFALAVLIDCDNARSLSQRWSLSLACHVVSMLYASRDSNGRQVLLFTMLVFTARDKDFDLAPTVLSQRILVLVTFGSLQPLYFICNLNSLVSASGTRTVDEDGSDGVL